MTTIDSNPDLATIIQSPSCRHCGAVLHRIPRSWFIKTFFFWLPLKRYICYGCLRKQWRLG